MTKFTEIKIVRAAGPEGFIGFLSFVFDGAFHMNSIGIWNKMSGGIRLTYPKRKNTEKEMNFFYPISRNITEEIEEIVLKELNSVRKF